MIYLIYLASFIVAMSLLIGFHEWAHFITARRFGIKVNEFSLGMGPPLFSRTGKDGVIYKICAFPLGGYVKMHESEGDAARDIYADRAFNKQRLGVRFLVVFNGPLSNFVLAVFLLFIVGLFGILTYKPIVGDVIEGGWAQQNGIERGDEIVSVGGVKVNSWSSFLLALFAESGNEQLKLETNNIHNGMRKDLNVDLSTITLTREGDSLSTLGITPPQGIIPPVIGSVTEGLPAYDVFEPDDIVLSVNNHKVENWKEMASFITSSKGHVLRFEFQRGDEIHHANIEPSHSSAGYVIGISSKPSELDEVYFSRSGGGVFTGIRYALTESASIFMGTVGIIKKLFTGDIPLYMMSGPVGIAKATGDSLISGWATYVTVLATLSISLCIMNLLPIPMLDGGHLLFYCFEYFAGSPLSDEAQRMLGTLGAMLIYSAIFFVIASDIYYTII